MALVAVTIGIDHRDLDAVDEANCIDAHFAIVVTIVGPLDVGPSNILAPSRKAIPCRRTFAAFFA